MSLNLIRKNSSSPFHLQRSIVPQGDEDGAYARGGFNPDALYNNDAANAAVESIGTTVGAALSSRTKGDINKENVKKSARLEKRQQRIVDKKIDTAAKDEMTGSNSTKRQDRLTARFDRITKRKNATDQEIKDYDAYQKGITE